MKIRIQNNSIRLRVDKQELEALALRNSVTMETPLTNTELTIVVTPSTDACSTLLNNKLSITLPHERIVELYSSGEEGFKEMITVDKENTLAILFQKDYVCIGRDKELNKGLFQNPNIANGTC